MNTQFDLSDLKNDLSKLSIRDQVRARLATMIRSGLLQEGDELPSERDLAATLEVSRETIRGAVQSLAVLGMVEVSHGSRTRVLGMESHLPTRPSDDEQASSDDELNVFEARRLVELPTVRLAVERIGPEDLSRLKRLVEAQRGMTNDPVRFQISDAEFHGIIYRASGNPLLSDFLRNAYSFGLGFRRRVLLMPGAIEASLNDHAAILAGFETQNPDAAAAAIEAHLVRIHRTTLDAMGER